MNTFGKVVGTIALLLMAIVGLLMSLCGGVFTVSSLGSREEVDLLVISLPSLVVGLCGLWFACRKLHRRLSKQPER